MFRRTLHRALRHRPKEVKAGVSSNRFLEEPWFTKAKEMFTPPPFPHKPVIHNWRFFIKPGKAANGPPLAQNFPTAGLKAIDFCKAFNDRTKPVFKDDIDLIVRIQVYSDKTYTWRIEPPPIAWFLLRAARKKVRESGPPGQKARWTAYLTMEMIYEIAKIKQNWADVENPSVEERVRHIAAEATRMGIAVIGAQTPFSSPVKGMTPAEYERQSAEYRKQQWEKYQEFRQEQLHKADLIERLHRPEMKSLTQQQLQDGLKDPNLFSKLWVASHPGSRYQTDAHRRSMAVSTLQGSKWIKQDAAPEEVAALFLNWQMPSIEKMRQLKGVQPEETEAFWARSDNNVEAVPSQP